MISPCDLQATNQTVSYRQFLITGTKSKTSEEALLLSSCQFTIIKGAIKSFLLVSFVAFLLKRVLQTWRLSYLFCLSINVFLTHRSCPIKASNR